MGPRPPVSEDALGAAQERAAGIDPLTAAANCGVRFEGGAASGAFVVFGSESPVGGSSEVTRIMTEGWEAKVGGSLHFEPDVDKMYDMVVAHIQKKRDALGINQKKERVLLDMEARRQLDV